MIYYGRFKLNGVPLSWHRIDGDHPNAESAKRKFRENTYFSYKQVEVTTEEPMYYCGKYKREVSDV